MAGFRFDGVHSGEMGLRVYQVTDDLLPGTRDYELEIPGRPGVWDFGADPAKRVVEIEVGLVGKDLEELRARAREVAAWLDPSRGVRQLVLDEEPDKYYMARCAGQVRLETVLPYGRVGLSFSCPDPYAYAVFDDVLTYSAPGTYAFYRQGTAVSYPRIEIEGASAGNGVDKIIVGLGGKTLTYTGPLAAGEKLVLDSDRLTAYRETSGGLVSAINALDSLDFPVAAPGNNELILAVDGAAAITRATIICRSRWL